MNDYQGKRKDQVERSYKGFIIPLGIVIAMVILSMLFSCASNKPKSFYIPPDHKVENVDGVQMPVYEIGL